MCDCQRRRTGKRLTAIVADRNQRQKNVERARIVLASADRGPAQRIAQRMASTSQLCGAGNSASPKRG